MTTLFEFGTFWFWLLIVAVTVIFTTITELEESSSWHWWVFLGVPVLLYFTGCKEEIESIINFAKTNPLSFIGLIAGYFMVGLIWSLVKWWFYLTGLREYYRKYPYNYKSNSDKFKVTSNKERILNWMMYWPLSGVWTLINDPIKKLFVRMYNSMEGRFQKISDIVTKEFENYESPK